MAEHRADIICNGELEIIQITDDLHDDIVEFFKKNFMKNENLSMAHNLIGSELAMDEMDAGVRSVLKRNLGYIARQCENNEIVAICVNRMLSPAISGSQKSNPKSPEIVCLGAVIQKIKSSYDILQEWNIDCAMEILFLSTRHDYNGRGLATILSERSIAFARQMLEGKLPNLEHLPKPKAVYSIFTSNFTQKLGDKLGMQTLARIPYTEFCTDDGKTLAERIKPIHTCITLAGLRL